MAPRRRPRLPGTKKEPATWTKNVVYGIVACLAAVGVGYALHVRQSVLNMPRTSGKGLTIMPLAGSAEGQATQIEIVTRAAETGGKYYEFTELANMRSNGFFPSRPASPPPHLHRSQNETFTVLKGVMVYEADGVVAHAKAGEVVLVPAGVTHTWWVGESEGNETKLSIKLEPAGKFGEASFETFAGFTRDYGSMQQTPLPQVALWFEEQDMDMMFLPTAVRWVVKTVMVPLAKLLGYKAAYPIYSTSS